MVVTRALEKRFHSTEASQDLVNRVVQDVRETTLTAEVRELLVASVGPSRES